MRGVLVLFGLLFLPSVALADTREEVMSGAARCAGLTDDRVWLDCFYGSAQPMRAQLGLAPAAPAQVKLVPPPGAAYPGAVAVAPRQAPPEKSSSFIRDILGSTKPAVSNMPMASYRFERDGKFVVVLKNGQTYRQLESDLVLAKWDRAPETYLVTIIGAVDGFVLKVKDQPGVVFHVRRV